MDNGNLLGLVSSYETADGATHDMADVWFVADKTAAYATDGLRDKVTGLVQAMSGFGGASSGSTPSTLPGLGEAPAAGVQGAVAVGGLVDALKQFDANGQSVAPVTGVASLVPEAPSLTDPTKTGILVPGK